MLGVFLLVASMAISMQKVAVGAEIPSRLSPEMEKALNAQINKEFASAYLYLSMAAYFESINLEGCAHWMRAQYQEENEHALKIFDYVNERGGRVKLTLLPGPQGEWDSPAKAFAEAFHHERAISKSIDQLVGLSKQAGDNATFDFLQWFVDEQVEEEANVEQVIHDLMLVEKDPAGLLMLDRELGKRE
jgi:ferritin